MSHSFSLLVLQMLGLWKKYRILNSLSSLSAIYLDPQLCKVLYLFVDISCCRANFSRFLDSTVAELWTMVPTSRCDIAAVSCNTAFLLSGSWQLCVLPAQKYQSLPCSCWVLPQQPQQVQAERCVALLQSCGQLKNFCAEVLPVSREP